MSRGIKVTLTGRALIREKIKELIRENGHLTETEMEDLSDTIAQAMAKNTEPFGLGANAKDAGDRLVQADIMRSIGVLQPEMWAFLERRGAPRNAAHVNLKWMRGAELKSVYLEELDMDASLEEIDIWHEDNRVKGRVKKQIPRSRTLTTSPQSRERYIEREQKNVGLAKAGWLAAMSGRSRSRYSPPKWLRANIQRALGESRKYGNGETVLSIESRNNVSYASHVIKRSKIEASIYYGYKWFLKQWEARREKMVEKFNE